MAAGLLLATALALGGCERDSSPPAPLAFPSAPAGSLEVSYPLDNTLFPPEIVAPTFVWSDETEGVAAWAVMLRFADEPEPLRFTSSEPGWRPPESDWSDVKARSVSDDAEVAIVGLGPEGNAVSSAKVRIRATPRDITW